MARGGVLLVLVVLVVRGGPAAADVLRPPDECRAGVPLEAHNPRCVADECPAAGCPEGMACREAAVCIGETSTGGRKPRPTEEVTGLCDEKGGCPAGQTCRRVRTCVQTIWRRMGCEVGAAAPLPAGFGLLALGLLALWRRR